MADINPILELMEKLRDKDKGCPWDIKQDHNSIAHCSIEEAYELVAAMFLIQILMERFQQMSNQSCGMR